MMFLQFFIWGAWYATGGNYMKSHGMTNVIYLAYMASAIGAIVSPFFLGVIADRFFPVQKVLGRNAYPQRHLCFFCTIFCGRKFYINPLISCIPVLAYALLYANGEPGNGNSISLAGQSGKRISRDTGVWHLGMDHRRHYRQHILHS